MNFRIFRFCCFALSLAFLLSFSTTLYAKDPNVVTENGAYAYPLKVNKTYKRFDVTGDGIPDKLRIKADPDQSNLITKLKVYVNGVRSLTKYYRKGADPTAITSRATAQIKYLRSKNKVPFLYVHLSTSNGYYAGGWLYSYQNKKLKTLLDTSNIVKFYASTHQGAWRCYEILSKLSGNSIEFSVGSFSTTPQSYRYHYTDGKLQPE